jgi:hypothetical protein
LLAAIEVALTDNINIASDQIVDFPFLSMLPLMIVRYDWDSKEVYMPIGVRFGKVIVGAKSSWNIYGEYQTSLVYDDYPGPAVADSFRFNVTYTMPGI